MFEDNSDYINLYNSLEKIDVKKVKPGSVRFIEYASPGAMGTPGNFTMLTEDCKVSENNYLEDKDSLDDIFKAVPDFDNELGVFISSAEKTCAWDILNMGMGNCLFVNKKIAAEFYKSIKLFMDFDIKRDAYSPGTLYLNWLKGAVYALKMEEFYKEQNNGGDRNV